MMTGRAPNHPIQKSRHPLIVFSQLLYCVLSGQKHFLMLYRRNLLLINYFKVQSILQMKFYRSHIQCFHLQRQQVTYNFHLERSWRPFIALLLFTEKSRTSQFTECICTHWLHCICVHSSTCALGVLIANDDFTKR